MNSKNKTIPIFPNSRTENYFNISILFFYSTLYSESEFSTVVLQVRIWKIISFVLCIAGIRNRRLQFEALQHLIQILPSANRDTLHALLNFLALVAHNSSDTTDELGELVFAL